MSTPWEPAPRSRDRTQPALRGPPSQYLPEEPLLYWLLWPQISFACSWISYNRNHTVPILWKTAPLTQHNSLWDASMLLHTAITFLSVVWNYHNLRIHCIGNGLPGVACSMTVTGGAAIGRFLCLSCHGSKHSFLLGKSCMSMSRTSGPQGKYMASFRRYCRMIF